MQTTSEILMIRPVNFGFNAETAVNNAFQVATESDHVQAAAVAEFDAFVSALKQKGVRVIVISDSADPHTPDSIFPNNWISFHEDGTVFLYPMFAVNRRLERKPTVLEEIQQHFLVNNIIDLTFFEQENLFLEGTGSMVLDRPHHTAYACLSPRTSNQVLNTWCQDSGYQPVSFHATDERGMEIYHTNVMMCVADRYVVICLESIRNAEERNAVIKTIRTNNQELIEISLGQMNHFAGNMLQVNNEQGEKLLVMSSQAYGSLNASQIGQLTRYNPIIHSPLSIIESNGGGSARCMMAEIHLPARPQRY